MLVLTRKRDESIKIGDDIIIKVVLTSKGSVKLGIEAPPHIRVMRAELTNVPTASDSDAMIAGKPETAKVEVVSSSPSILRDLSAEFVADMEDQLLVSTAL